MNCMAHSNVNDNLLISLLVNKSKLCNSSNATVAQTSTIVKPDCSLNSIKLNETNQILTLSDRVDQLEKKVQYILSLPQYAKLKKE
jgi:hypothetical protein